MKRQLGRVTDPAWVRLLFILCWAVYFATYIGRLNYSSAMTELIAGEILTKSQAGSISMVFFFCYGGGQMISGFLGDRLSPKWMIFIGVSVSAVMNLMMGSISLFPVMVLLWGVNGFAQSMIWPPIVHIFAHMLEGETMVKCSIHITSSVAMGTLGSYLLSAAMLKVSGWRMVFWAAAAVLALFAFLWFVGFGRIERRAAAREEGEAAVRPVPPRSGSFWKTAVGGGLLILVLPVVIQGILKDGVTAWVPTYINESFGASPVLSVLLTAVLPIVNLSGAYAANFCNRRFFHNEVRTSGFFFLVALGALLLLRFAGNLYFSVLLLAILTSCMLAINTMLITLVPLHFGKAGMSSTMSGFLNCTAYLGAAISTFSIGVLVERAGWNVTILSWAALAALALILCVLGRKRDFSDGEQGEPYI